MSKPMTLQVSITFDDGKIARKSFATWLKHYAPNFKTKSMNKNAVTKEEVGTVIHDALQQFCLNVTAFHEKAELEKMKEESSNVVQIAADGEKKNGEAKDEE